MSARAAIVTGVGTATGIGVAVARALRADGCALLVQSFDPPGVAEATAASLGEGVEHVRADLGDPGAPAALVAHAVERFGRADVLVACHCADFGETLDEVTAESLDRAWAVNARADVLLVQAFARIAPAGGRVVLFTSGQHLAPMAAELPYAISKGAIHQMTRSLADAVAERGITVNTVNPGPVDTGYPSDQLRERLRPAFPAGRWGRPEDIAPLVRWLASEESAWVTGQVIDAEGGFRREPLS